MPKRQLSRHGPWNPALQFICLNNLNSTASEHAFSESLYYSFYKEGMFLKRRFSPLLAPCRMLKKPLPKKKMQCRHSLRLVCVWLPDLSWSQIRAFLMMTTQGMREGNIMPEHTACKERPALLLSVTRPQASYFCAMQFLYGADLHKCVALGLVIGRNLIGEKLCRTMQTWIWWAP